MLNFMHLVGLLQLQLSLSWAGEVPMLAEVLANFPSAKLIYLATLAGQPKTRTHEHHEDSSVSSRGRKDLISRCSGGEVQYKSEENYEDR